MASWKRFKQRLAKEEPIDSIAPCRALVPAPHRRLRWGLEEAQIVIAAHQRRKRIARKPRREQLADLMTLVSSALRNDLDVWAYVKDVLDQLLAGSTDYASLRPDRWAAAHPEHIRVYRADERRDRAAAQHHRRARRRSAKQNPG